MKSMSWCKKMGILCLLGTVLINTSGCERKTVSETKNAAANVNKEGAKSTNQLKMISTPWNGCWNGICSTKDGCYYIDTDRVDKDNQTIPTLKYMDYKTGKEIYLCSKSNCKHEKDSCDAVMPDDFASNRVTMFEGNDCIYMVDGPEDMSGATVITQTNGDAGEEMSGISVDGQEAESVIYQIDKDGSHREKVFSFGSGEVVEDKFFTDGTDYYAITKKIKEEKQGKNHSEVKNEERKLVKLNMEEQTEETVIPLDDQMEIIGCADGQLITGYLKFQHKMSSPDMLDDAKYKAEYEKAKYLIERVDLSTGTKKEIKKFNCHDDYTYQLQEGKLYYNTKTKKQVMELDIKTKKERQLAKIDGDLDAVYGTYLIVNKGRKKKQNLATVDINTGNISTQVMKLLNSKQEPITVSVNGKKRLLVVRDYAEKTEHVDFAGVDQTEMTDEKYAFLDIEDYVKGNSNYRDVKRVRD